jgi:hypothetical protein
MNRRSFLKVAAASVPIVLGGTFRASPSMGGMQPDFRSLKFHVQRMEFSPWPHGDDIMFVGNFEEPIPSSEIIVRDGRFVWTKEPDADVLVSSDHQPGDSENVYGESAWLALNPESKNQMAEFVRRYSPTGYVDLVDCFQPGLIHG